MLIESAHRSIHASTRTPPPPPTCHHPRWDDIKALLVATAVLYPVFVLLAVLVSAWRAYLAKTLDNHRPGARGAA